MGVEAHGGKIVLYDWWPYDLLWEKMSFGAHYLKQPTSASSFTLQPEPLFCFPAFRSLKQPWTQTSHKKKILITTLMPTTSAWMVSASVPVTRWSYVRSVLLTTEVLTTCKSRTTCKSSALKSSSRPSGKAMNELLSMFPTDGLSSPTASLLAMTISRLAAKNVLTGVQVCVSHIWDLLHSLSKVLIKRLNRIGLLREIKGEKKLRKASKKSKKDTL